MLDYKFNAHAPWNIYEQHLSVMSLFPDGMAERIQFSWSGSLLTVRAETQPSLDVFPLLSQAPPFVAGECGRVGFSIFVNPTASVPQVGGRGKVAAITDEAECAEWVRRKLTRAGLCLHSLALTGAGWCRGTKGRDKISVYGVTAAGSATVSNYGNLNEAVCRGIGRAKGFGFGMLRLHPD